MSKTIKSFICIYEYDIFKAELIFVKNNMKYCSHIIILIQVVLQTTRKIEPVFHTIYNKEFVLLKIVIRIIHCSFYNLTIKLTNHS